MIQTRLALFALVCASLFLAAAAEAAPTPARATVATAAR